MMTPIARIARWFVKRAESCDYCHDGPRIVDGRFCSDDCERAAVELQAFSM